MHKSWESKRITIPKKYSKRVVRMIHKKGRGKRYHICKVSGEKENGLRGKSGDLGLNAFANNSSPESELDVRASEPIDANPLLPLLACC